MSRDEEPLDREDWLYILPSFIVGVTIGTVVWIGVILVALWIVRSVT